MRIDRVASITDQPARIECLAPSFLSHRHSHRTGVLIAPALEKLRPPHEVAVAANDIGAELVS